MNGVLFVGDAPYPAVQHKIRKINGVFCEQYSETWGGWGRGVTISLGFYLNVEKPVHLQDPKMLNILLMNCHIKLRKLIVGCTSKTLLAKISTQL